MFKHHHEVHTFRSLFMMWVSSCATQNNRTMFDFQWLQMNDYIDKYPITMTWFNTNHSPHCLCWQPSNLVGDFLPLLGGQSSNFPSLDNVWILTKKIVYQIQVALFSYSCEYKKIYYIVEIISLQASLNKFPLILLFSKVWVSLGELHWSRTMLFQ